MPPLQGAVNFRDLGGYRTQDGRRVRWGKLYRSGSMSGLTTADYAYLAGLNIRSVCNLRTADEREVAPNHWALNAGIGYWCRDYESTFGVLRSLLSSGLPSVAAAREALLAGYRRLPFEHAPAYRALFERLQAGEIPLVFNCSAGKDRAGTAAALILSLLGVPRETILDDYALTDRVFAARPMLATMPANEPGHVARGESMLAKISPDILAIVMGTHPGYLNGAFEMIEVRHGSLAGYFRDELGIGDDGIALIRDRLLEP